MELEITVSKKLPVTDYGFESCARAFRVCNAVKPYTRFCCCMIPKHCPLARAPHCDPLTFTTAAQARLRCKSWIAAHADPDGGGPACDCEPRGDVAFAGAVNVRVAAPAARALAAAVAPAAAAPAARALAAAAPPAARTLAAAVAPAAGVALGCSSWAKLVESSCSSRCGTSQSAAWSGLGLGLGLGLGVALGGSSWGSWAKFVERP